jgi:transcriptional regulator of arginine metabolism
MAKTLSIQDRLQVLRELLEREEASTQEELREELERRDFEVNQSTISRDLRRLGAIKQTDADGETTYRLPSDPHPGGLVSGLKNLIRGVHHNGAMIVILTDAGAASLIARQVDALRSDDILGTIAGDDAIFVAPVSVKKIEKLTKEIAEALS